MYEIEEKLKEICEIETLTKDEQYEYQNLETEIGKKEGENMLDLQKRLLHLCTFKMPTKSI